MITRYNIDNYWRAASNPKMNESENGEYVKWSDVEPIIAENSELRKRLAVFTEGMPTKYGMNKCANLAHEAMMKPGEYVNEAMKAVDYLRRIASANEVTNDKP